MLWLPKRQLWTPRRPFIHSRHGQDGAFLLGPAPGTPAVPEVLVHGQSFGLTSALFSGISFGTKPTPTPIGYDDFSGGTPGNNVSGVYTPNITGGATNSTVKYSNTFARGVHTKTAKVRFGSDEIGGVNLYKTWADAGSTDFFMHYWSYRKWDTFADPLAPKWGNGKLWRLTTATSGPFNNTYSGIDIAYGSRGGNPNVYPKPRIMSMSVETELPGGGTVVGTHNGGLEAASPNVSGFGWVGPGWRDYWELPAETPVDFEENAPPYKELWSMWTVYCRTTATIGVGIQDTRFQFVKSAALWTARTPAAMRSNWQYDFGTALPYFTEINVGNYYRTYDSGEEGVGFGPQDNHVSCLYIDNSWAHVELGNNAVYDSCTIREMQPTTAWASGAITATCNKGALSSGTVYPFVVKTDGTILSGSAHTMT